MRRLTFHLQIRNIHIRYEDKLSVPGHPFSVGLTLSKFSAVSTDSNWEPTFITNPAGGIHKLANLDSLAVYFDTDSESLAGYPIEEAIQKFTSLIATQEHTPEHQFVLKPVSGQGRLVLNKKVDAQTPKTDAELLFKELGFVLDADQYRDALSMVDLFHFYIRQREYRGYRPPQIEIDRNRNRALWKFAINAIRSEVHDKHKRWSWAYFAERRDDRKAYVKLFKAKTLGEITIEVRFSSPFPRRPQLTDSSAGIARTCRPREKARLQGHPLLPFHRPLRVAQGAR